jgi:hypothetical protein
VLVVQGDEQLQESPPQLACVSTHPGSQLGAGWLQPPSPAHIAPDGQGHVCACAVAVSMKMTKPERIGRMVARRDRLVNQASRACASST